MRVLSSSVESRATLICPKCGFEQRDGSECLRCGIIFSKFKPPTLACEAKPAPVADRKSQLATPALLSRVFRILSWISLTLSIGALLLILRQTSPLPIQIDSRAADRVAEKMAQLQIAVQASKPRAVTLDEAELNQWMRDNLAITSAHQVQQVGIRVPAGSEPNV